MENKEREIVEFTIDYLHENRFMFCLNKEHYAPIIAKGYLNSKTTSLPTPTAEYELDLEERAKRYADEKWNLRDFPSEHTAIDYKKGWNDHTQTKQSKAVEVIEALEQARQWIDGQPASQHTIELIDKALTKLKQ